MATTTHSRALIRCKGLALLLMSSLAVLAVLAPVAGPSAQVFAGADDRTPGTITDDLAAAKALSARIDQHIAARWQKDGIEPSKPADDYSWLRRARIDANGRIPEVGEAISFAADRDPAKRERAVMGMVGGEEWASHWAWVYTAAFVGRMGGRDQEQGRGYLPLFLHEWIEERLARGEGYDSIVQEMLGSKGWLDENSAVSFYLRWREPENAVGAASRLFLGTQIQCAQCHDHPYLDWTQKQFFEMAAFFVRLRTVNKKLDKPVEPRPGMDGGGMTGGGRGGSSDGGMTGSGMEGQMLDNIRKRMRTNRRQGVVQRTGAEIRIPQSGDASTSMVVTGGAAMFRPDVVDPRFITGALLSRKLDADRRQEFARFVVTDGMHLFSRAAVNRIWKQMFGRGIVDPVDDLESEATHPELLKLLADEFVAHGCDIRHIQRAIMLTQAYALSSEPNEVNANDQEIYARAYLRPMAPEVLFRSIIEATGADEQPAAGKGRNKGRNRRAKRVNPRQLLQLMGRMVYTFDDDEMAEALDYEASIPQALMFLNGDLIHNGAKMGVMGLLQRDLSAKASDDERISHLFLRVLSRPPHRQELTMVRRLLRSAGRSDEARQEIYEDVYWALLNSSEFFFNH